MMRSLSSAVGGLRAHQTKMDVIGTNIANVNTYGFKSSRVTFSDVYYQNLNAATAPNGSVSGGTNPTQIGYGASVATIDLLNSQSGMASTDRALDIYINGDGMIATKDADGNLRYSRLGILGFDAAGNLVDSNGNFVMGFPMNTDGTPRMNPDGSCDPGDLTYIKCPPEMLDAMTGISIGTSGDIIGVMPGETKISTNRGLPAWLTDINIKDDSNLSGDVKVTMANVSNVTSGSVLPDWISSVSAPNNSGLKGIHDFTYDATNKIITMTGENGEVYEGEYVKNGAVTFKDISGKPVMTVQTNNTAPTAGPTGSVTFEMKQMLSVAAQDKGGNKINQSVEYVGQTTVTLGDITLTIDPSKVDTKTVTSAALANVSTMNPDISAWLKGLQIKEGSDYKAGNLTVQAGKEYVVNIGQNSSGGSATNFINKAQFADNLAALGIEGDVKISILPTGGAGTGGASTPYDVRVEIGTGASAQVFTANVMATATGEITGPVTLTGGLVLPLSTPWPTSTNGLNTTSLGSIKSQNVIILSDSTGEVAKTVVTGRTDRVIVGDVTLAVDGSALQDFFTTGAGSTGLHPAAAELIGTLSKDEVQDWALDGNVASASTGDGEKVYIGNIALAKVPNMEAMQQVGESYFTTSSNSGEATFYKPGLSGTGTLKAGNLEMSNVDISKEFTDMITTQRGFQANTRIITVSDEMLQELVNLKR